MLLRLLRLFAPFLLCILVALSLAASTFDPVAAAPETGRPDKVSLALDAGAAAAPSSLGGYMSPVTQAAHPFTHIMVRWEASLPVSDTLALELRASLDGTTWSDWGRVAADPDLWTPADGDSIFWSQVLYAGEGMQYWQLRAIMRPAPDGSLPTLRQIDVNTVDGRFASDQPQAPAAGLQALDKPSVISRSAWGSPDGQSSRVRPVYYPVNHMVVHHTVDPNSLTTSESNWGDRVRAIWSFHTFTRGWGDIGYNYLVAPSGEIFEGRAGGDDAVAFHDAANYGSMGVSMIGTYNSVLPTAAAQESLVSLLAWKANQKDIDPLGRSYYYGCDISNYCAASGAVVENIAGHRQTNNQTTCPGDALHALLPEIRNRVKDRLLGGSGDPTQPDNGDLLIDELETSFIRSDATWNRSGCGYGGNTYYTYTTDNPAESENSAVWRPTIPVTGRYRVYASIPQGCGLPNATTTRAMYRINSAGGSVQQMVDQNTAEAWVDLGTYTFAAGTSGSVELSDLTGEPYSEQRVLFFDSVKWVPEAEVNASVDLVRVSYERDSVAAGETLKVTFTVRNSGDVAIQGQSPQAGTRPDGSYDPANGYVYDENECFLGAEGLDYPSFPKETDRFRVTLGPTDRSVTCAGSTGGYPWRWGLNGMLEPGQQRDIVGYVRFREPGRVSLQAGIIQEYVKYHVQGMAATTITVTPERVAPVPVFYDGSLRPMAQVYKLGTVPDNLLARTRNPLSIPRGAFVGNFAWDGSTQDWGDGGPLGQSDGFLIEQTRIFMAPVDGSYAFRTTSDDGSWLWIDGQEVVANYGLHTAETLTGTITLRAGAHVLSFRYFERTGNATAGYSVQVPGAAGFGAPPDNLDRSIRLGATFASAPDLILAADDQGGSGLAKLRYSWDGNAWFEEPVGAGLTPLLRLGRLVNGSYRLRYQAIDSAGNTSPLQDISFVVDTTMRVEQVYLPLVGR